MKLIIMVYLIKGVHPDGRRAVRARAHETMTLKESLRWAYPLVADGQMYPRLRRSWPQDRQTVYRRR